MRDTVRGHADLSAVRVSGVVRVGERVVARSLVFDVDTTCESEDEEYALVSGPLVLKTRGHILATWCSWISLPKMKGLGRRERSYEWLIVAVTTLSSRVSHGVLSKASPKKNRPYSRWQSKTNG